MKLGDWLLVLMLLFQIRLCWSICEVYGQVDDQQVARCAKTVTVIEEAITSNDVDLFKLRDIYKQAPPTLLEINYTVRLSDTENNHVDHQHYVKWTSSSILTIISPKFLLALQPGILTGLYWFQNNTLFRNVSLLLNIPVEILPPLQSSRGDEIQYGLESITLKVSDLSVFQVNTQLN